MSSKPTTTRGALSRIIQEDDRVESPILQVLAYKKIDTDGTLKYRFILSDGDYMHQCCIMTTEQLAQRVESGEFERYTLIRLDDYVINFVKGNKVCTIISKYFYAFYTLL